MILKIVALFLIFMAVLAMFGKLRLPGQEKLGRLTGRKRLSRGKCPKCGAPRIGRGPCPCGHKG